MRRPTLIMIVVLFAVIAAAAVVQLSVASRDVAPLEGPLSPGALPSLPADPSP